MQTCDVLILGSGIAGLSSALKFASKGLRVSVVSKNNLMEGATRYAQGGIASVWSKEDSFEEHIRDTLQAGSGLCKEDVVKFCVVEGPKRVNELIDYGVPFTKRQNQSGDPADQFDLHKEGGHQKRRILHADDLTGLAIEKTLVDRIREHPNIEIFEEHIAVDLITEAKAFKAFRKTPRCLGAYILNKDTGKVEVFSALLTVLATGGSGKAYLYTSNPDTATGDGIAMAHRAGARIANMEFTQFHPTCLYHPQAKNFLITEALRGEGAKLKRIDGTAFMEDYHELGSLAPRDITALAIDSEMKKTGDKYVHLDCRELGEIFLKEHFPNIFEQCLDFGIDITKEPIPIVPAAHYMCGGVLVDETAKTNVEGLFAVGEVACTGLHGANRLASNSLLEAVVFAERCFQEGLKTIATGLGHDEKQMGKSAKKIPEWETGAAVELEEQIDVAANWAEIRHLMWNYVGIVRSNRRLERAKRRISMLTEEITTYYWNYLLTQDLIELRNLVLVADLIVQCAAQRKESRGLHFNLDFPGRDDRLFSRFTIV